MSALILANLCFIELLSRHCEEERRSNPENMNADDADNADFR